MVERVADTKSEASRINQVLPVSAHQGRQRTSLSVLGVRVHFMVRRFAAVAIAGVVWPVPEAFAIDNGDFTNGLTDWQIEVSPAATPPGDVTIVDGAAQLTEGRAFVVSIHQTFTVPVGAQTLSFDIVGLYPDSTGDALLDAFEASLIDGAGASVVPVHRAGTTSYVNRQEDGTGSAATGVAVVQGPSAVNVAVDISGVPSGTTVTFVASLVNGDGDDGGTVTLDNVVLDVFPPECLPGAGPDDDGDTVPDACDDCPGFDDHADADGDTIADGCDLCAGGNDLADVDGDGVPDACDRCPGFDDAADVDFDGFPDACDGCVGTVQSETFPPAPASSVDILLILDDSCSMGNDQTLLANNFGDFITAMTGLGADWQLAVITTTSTSFRGPVITNTPNAQTEFASQVNVGTGGNNVEEGIERAWEATQTGADAGPGSSTGFLRSGAVLSLVFVSDELDQSDGVTPSAAVTYWLSLKGGDPDKFVANGIVIPPPNGGYDTVITSAGGQMYDIASTSWGTDLASIAVGSLGTLIEPLASVPVPESLAVQIDGVATEGWVYDQCQNLLLFEGENRPSSGAVVSVGYRTDCGGGLGHCSDGLDNDGDGLVDYPNEPGCATACDTNEQDPYAPLECADGLDNDGDSVADLADPGCASAADRDESCTDVGSDGFGYRMCEDAGAASVCPDLSTSNSALGLGAEGTATVPLGFTFDYYGTSYTTVYVGANGTLSFEQPNSPSSNVCLPYGGLDGTILAWWDDLDPSSGSVWARTSGVAPRRRLEVQWRAPHQSGGGDLDVRAVLDEDTGDVHLCYVDSTAGAGIDDGISATAGLQGNQSLYLEYSCSSAQLTQGRVVRFRHP